MTRSAKRYLKMTEQKGKDREWKVWTDEQKDHFRSLVLPRLEDQTEKKTTLTENIR